MVCMYRSYRKGYLTVLSSIGRNMLATWPLFVDLQAAISLKADIQLLEIHILFFFQSVMLVMLVHIGNFVGSFLFSISVKMITVNGVNQNN